MDKKPITELLMTTITDDLMSHRNLLLLQHVPEDIQVFRRALTICFQVDGVRSMFPGTDCLGFLGLGSHRRILLSLNENSSPKQQGGL